MDYLKLSPRLAAVYGMAKDGMNIIDVGTDHGYIPIKLALDGTKKSIIATDLRPAPLDSARRDAMHYGVEDKICFKLCDGLDFNCAEDSDTVIIAGMGGLTIINILSKAQWTKNGALLILQPQSKIDDLCQWLYDNGYNICSAHLEEDAGRIYIILSVRPGPSCLKYAEDQLLIQRDPLLLSWLDDRIGKTQKALYGMKLSREGPTPKMLAQLKRLENMRMDICR